MRIEEHVDEFVGRILSRHPPLLGRRRFLELSRFAAAIDRGGISEFDEARSGAVTVGFTVAVLDDKLLV
jgi:hypothetical protein